MRSCVLVVLAALAAGAVAIAGRVQSGPAAPMIPRGADIRLVPEDLDDTAWLQRLKDAQVKALGGVAVFHDFRFADRRSDSGITFRHRIVDDAGRTYKAAHYDHGNGLAMADVDGDGLTD